MPQICQKMQMCIISTAVLPVLILSKNNLSLQHYSKCYAPIHARCEIVQDPYFFWKIITGY